MMAKAPVTFEKFRAEHFRYLSPQALQKHNHAQLVGTVYADICENNFSISAWVNSRCIGAAGVIRVYDHRGMAWAVLSDDAGPYMLEIVRKVREYFAVSAFRRIEAEIHAEFKNGIQLARLLGMKCETPVPLKAHGGDGEDQYIYALVR